MRSRLPVLLVSGLLLSGLLAGCGLWAGDAEDPAGGPPTGQRAAGGAQRESGEAIAVAGLVTRGGDPGCLQLVTDVGVTYALLGHLADGLETGNAVRLRGIRSQHYLPDCDGIAFRVTGILARSRRDGGSG